VDRAIPAGYHGVYMGRFRLLLILMLVAAVDLGSPVLPQAGEAAEEFEEATHARRRMLRLVHTEAPTPAAVRKVALAAPRPAPHRPSARRAPVRKLPPPLPESASASDDH
jgi:hypothetical protein